MPIAIFMGSTGVGKTRRARALAEFLFDKLAGRFVESDTVVAEPDGETASNIEGDRV